MLTLYQDQYPMFGHAQMMPLKVTWDYAYYWGVLCQLMFQQRLTDLNLLGDMRAELEHAQALNTRMQQLFRQWHAASAAQSRREMLDQCALTWFAELNASLTDPLDDAGIRARLRDNVRLLDGIADALALQAASTDARLHAPLSGQPRPSLFPAVA
jgi:hypothetical protein